MVLLRKSKRDGGVAFYLSGIKRQVGGIRRYDACNWIVLKLWFCVMMTWGTPLWDWFLWVMMMMIIQCRRSLEDFFQNVYEIEYELDKMVDHIIVLKKMYGNYGICISQKAQPLAERDWGWVHTIGYLFLVIIIILEWKLEHDCSS